MSVVPAVGDHQQQRVDMCVSALERKAPSKSLRVPEPGLGLHRDGPTIPFEDLVPSPAIARDPEWHLRAMSVSVTDDRSKPREEGQMTPSAYVAVIRRRLPGFSSGERIEHDCSDRRGNSSVPRRLFSPRE